MSPCHAVDRCIFFVGGLWSPKTQIPPKHNYLANENAHTFSSWLAGARRMRGPNFRGFLQNTACKEIRSVKRELSCGSLSTELRGSPMEKRFIAGVDLCFRGGKLCFHESRFIFRWMLLPT